MMAICEGTDLDEAVALAAKVEKRLEPFVANGVVGRYESIFSYLPPAEQQREVLAALAAGSGEAFDPDRVRRTLAAALADNGFRVEPFEPYLARLDRFLAPERPLTIADLEGKGLDRIVNRYVRRDAGQVRVVTYLYPTRPEWRRTPPPGLVEALSLGDGGITVTGTNVLGRELKRIFLRDAWRAAFLGLTLVAVLLARRLPQPAAGRDRLRPARRRRRPHARLHAAARHADQLRQRLRRDDDHGRRHRLQHPPRSTASTSTAAGSTRGCWRPARASSSRPRPTSPDSGC